MLLAILLVLLNRGRGGSEAFADAPQQPPIAGGNGVFVMPAQMHPNIWGCYLLDLNHQTICTYEYRAGQQALVLTAARDFEYDLQLKNLNTYPAWYDIQKLVQDQNNNAGKAKAPASPEVTPQP